MKNVNNNQSAPKGDSSFLHNVQELATPLAGASVETGVEVHITGDVADRAASGGCPASPCSALSSVISASMVEGAMSNPPDRKNKPASGSLPINALTKESKMPDGS